VPTTKEIYLDHVSSTPVHPDIIKAMGELLPIHYANSDAIHSAGTRIDSLILRSRSAIAAAFNVTSEEIIFTSGATEANNTIIKGIALANRHKGNHLITSPVEHSSVYSSMEWLQDEFGFEVTYLPVDEDGRVRPQDLKDALRPETILVSIMHVNNEIGTIMPIDELADIVKAHSRAYFHVDCVQALGKMPIDLTKVDAASFSAHKINGVKGSGIMLKRKNVNMLPLISGGQQEFGLRGGTHNAIANILFAKTLRIALEAETEHRIQAKLLKQRLLDGLSRLDSVVINSPVENCSDFILNISCLSVTSEVMMNWLNAHGILISAQSTCSSKTKQPSHTLSAMHLEQKRLIGSLRIGIGASNTIEEIDRFLSLLEEGINTYGKI
jgi:cysteine desulfurase